MVENPTPGGGGGVREDRKSAESGKSKEKGKSQHKWLKQPTVGQSLQDAELGRERDCKKGSTPTRKHIPPLKKLSIHLEKQD